MTTSSSAVRRTRRALTGMGIVAASMLFLAPVAGAERPGRATVAQSDTSRNGPSARSSAPSGAEPDSQHEVVARDGAAQSPEGTGRYEHTLCHRTGSAADPYVRITVAFRTADGEVSSDGGHENHGGPVFDPATMGDGDTWGDIIPPFTTPDGVSYEGKNWPAGAATFDNGCEPVGWTDAAEPSVADGDRTPDRGEVPATRGDQPGHEEQDRTGLDPDDRADAATERAVAAPRQPDTRIRQSSIAGGGSTDAVEERVLRVGGATGDIAAVLGQQVTRDPGDGMVVPAADAGSTLAAGLARTDSTFLVLLMLGLSVLIGGYVVVDVLRERARRTD